jgi:hypothetical protein
MGIVAIVLKNPFSGISTRVRAYAKTYPMIVARIPVVIPNIIEFLSGWRYERDFNISQAA